MTKIKFQLSNDEYNYQNGKNVLPISDIPLNLIPKGPPKTGEIYLRLVHEEAKKCPKVVRKTIPETEETIITKETKNVNYLRKFFNKFEEEEEEERKSNQLLPTYLKPSKEWKDTFIKDFKKLRKIFNNFELPNNYTKEIFPALEDESNWKVYLYGKSKRSLKNLNLKLKNNEKDELQNLNLNSNKSDDKSSNITENNKKRKFNEFQQEENNKKMCTESLNNINNSDSLKIDRAKIEGKLPSLTIIKQMNQKIINKILYYHSLWIKNQNSNKQYQWIYALLISLDPLLTSSQISVLRDICKLCKNYRIQMYKDSLNSNEELDDKRKNMLVEKVAPLNIIITIITVFFSQCDLE